MKTQNPKKSSKLEQRARSLAAKGELKTAAELLLAEAQIEPHETARWLQIAQWQREARDFSGAAKTLQRALKETEKRAQNATIKSKSPAAKSQLSAANLSQESSFTQKMRSEIAASDARTSSLQNPERIAKSASRTIGKATVSSQEAAPQKESSTRFSPEALSPKALSPIRVSRELESLWLALCETQAEAQNWDECVASCRSLLRLAPRHHGAREILATALLHTDDLGSAETVLRELLLLSPRDPLHRMKLATLLQMQGKSGQALREFQRVAESYPEAPFAGETVEAIELLDNLQVQQLLMRAAEQPIFQQQMQNALDQTLAENGFQLTDEGRESLRHMMSDGRLAPIRERVRIH